jgi:glycosyltransferase involved in cell wall biosynthesis
MPKISIRIPTLNGFPSLEKAVQSVVEQDYKDRDIIVVDNNSDDGSWEKTRNLPMKFTEVKVVQNPIRGMAENWNYCITTATGDYLLIFHTDDIMLPGMIGKMVNFLDQNPSVGLVHANCIDVYENGSESIRITQTKPILSAGYEALFKVLSKGNWACSSVVVRRCCYDKLGLFLTNNPSPDAEMWARIVKDYDMGHIDEPLVKVFAHIDSYGRMALSKLPPKEISRQWKLIGDTVIGYFPPEHRKTAENISKSSGFRALLAATEVAFHQKRFLRGIQFFALAFNYTDLINWTYYLGKFCFRLAKKIVKAPFSRRIKK